MSGGAPPDLLGKDEVASSNLASSSKKSVIPTGMADFLCVGLLELASSSKTLQLLEFRGFLLFQGKKPDRILFRIISRKDAV